MVRFLHGLNSLFRYPWILLLMNKIAEKTMAVQATMGARSQSATAMAIKAQTPTKASSRRLRDQVSARWSIPARMIIPTAQVMGAFIKGAHWILVSQADRSAKKATDIHPAYRQKGHQTEAIVFSGGSVSSISVRRMIIQSEQASTSMINTERPV